MKGTVVTPWARDHCVLEVMVLECCSPPDCRDNLVTRYPVMNADHLVPKDL